MLIKPNYEPSQASQQCGRECLIQQELAHEAKIIKDQQLRLANFRRILTQTNDKALQTSIQATISNLETDLQYREHGFALANKELKHAVN
jgi:hypothetical protein